MDKLTMHSPELTERNIDRLAELFPTVVTEQRDDEGNLVRAVDFDLLRQELSGHVVDGPRERFQLDWPGKREALFAASAPIARAMRPHRKDSRAFDETQNIFIEGDNLEALKLLQESYLGQIKLIYIDPPYNSGSDRFIYDDQFTEGAHEFLIRSGQVHEEGGRLVANAETNGRFHSDWLSMMYPRLKLARNLLKEDGIILISIDDGEQANLRRILDEVFGEKNFLAQLIWDKQHSQQQGIFKRYHEFVLAYARNASAVDYIKGGEGVIEAGALKKVSRANPASEFEFPAGVRFEAPDGTIITGEYGGSEKVQVVSGTLRAEDGQTAEPVTLRAGWTQKNQMKSWFSGEETFDTRDQRVIEFFFSSTGKLKCLKERGRMTPSTLLPQYGMNSEQTAKLSNLMGGHIFDNPKPVPMMEDFIRWFTDDGDVVLDFFAGSGTTAEAAFRVAAETNSRRPFVLVQLPEETPADSPARQADYHTIAQLARERIRRAGDATAESMGLDTQKPDIGFRTFRIDTTNMTEVHRRPDELSQDQLELDSDNVKSDRTAEDLFFQVLVDWGMKPSVAIATRKVAGHAVWDAEDGALLACFDENVSIQAVGSIAKESPLCAVFRGQAFATDADRINAEQIFAEVSPSTDVKVI